MKTLYCLFRDGYGVGPVVAFQELFGRQFHSFPFAQTIGSIVNARVRKAAYRLGVKEGDVDPLPMRIIAPIHFNMIAAALRRGCPDEHAAGGYWYEVHGD
jgi:hypothetical protein